MNYNPYVNYPQYNTQYQPNYQQVQQNQFVPNTPQETVRTVNSIDEVSNSEVDWGGGINYYRLNNGQSIFTKQLTNDGNIRILEYKISSTPISSPTKDEKLINLEQELVTLREEFNKLKSELGGVSSDK